MLARGAAEVPAGIEVQFYTGDGFEVGSHRHTTGGSDLLHQVGTRWYRSGDGDGFFGQENSTVADYRREFRSLPSGGGHGETTRTHSVTIFVRREGVVRVDRTNTTGA